VVGVAVIPQPFMYWHRTLTGCYVDPWAPPSSQLFVVDVPVGPLLLSPMPFVEPSRWMLPHEIAPLVRQQTMPIVLAHPVAWAARGAHMLAQAYRPEGVP
jgi:hypothetical protein